MNHNLYSAQAGSLVILNEHLSSRRYEPPPIDLENKNISVSLAIDLIGYNKNVLEIGTSTGYVSKILKNRGNTITGIEYDREAGLIAEQYCRQVIFGDVETLDLDANLENSLFDVILCGDVLEHLKNPVNLLKSLKKFLKPGGYLVVSLPNFFHGDVLLNLLYGDFRYTPMGLLDETHLRFFGIKNIYQIFAESGFQISDIRTTNTDIGTTELKIDPKKIPQELLNFVQKLPDSTVFQFVFIAHPTENVTIPHIKEVDLHKLFSCVLEDNYIPVGSHRQEINDLNSVINDLNSVINDFNNTIRFKSQTLEQKDNEIALLTSTLNSIYMSTSWAVFKKFQRLMDVIFPTGTRRKRIFNLGVSGTRILVHEGFKSLFQSFIRYLHKDNEHQLKNEPNKEDFGRLKYISETFSYRPKISIITPVWNTEEKWLRLALDSVLNQIYDNWELCLVDGGSTKPNIKNVLNEYAEKDARIKVKFLTENKGIVGNSNEALALATGEFLVFLDHDDELTRDSLYEIVKLLNEHPDADIIYSDDDKIDENGNQYDFHFKPDWSPELLLSYCYFSHIQVLRRTLVDRIGRFRKDFEGAQDYDLLLRATEKTDEIHHIPKVLYHWRSVRGSLAFSPNEKPVSIEKGRKAVEDAIDRRGISGNVIVPEFAQKGRLGIYKINFVLKNKPKISIIIPTKDKLELLKRCINSIESKTTYDNYEIVIIDNGSEEKETLEYLNRTKHKVIPIKSDGFNFSKINNIAVSKIDSEFVLLLNNDTEVISEYWLDEMLGYLVSDPKIGAVGAKLIYKDGRVQHAGVVLGFHNGLAGHANKLIHHTEIGYFSYAAVVRNFSAVTAACLLTRKKYYEEVGGLDEKNFSVAYNDVDFCLKLIQKGYRIVFNPYALLYHDEARSRGIGHDNPSEEMFLRKKWGYLIQKGDPYYNPNLSLEDEKFKLKKKIPENQIRFVDPKKFLFISHNLNFEGAPLSQFKLAKELKKRGYNIIVVSPADGPLKKYYFDIGVGVKFCGNNLHSKDERKTFISWVESNEFGLAYVNTIVNYQYIDLLFTIGIPTIWGIHESEREYYFSTFKSLGSKYFRIADRVVFVSNATREKYSDLEYNDNFQTIYNGLDLKEIELFNANNNKFNLREKYDIPRNSKIVTIVGTTCERKGQKIFVEAAIRILKDTHNSDIHFIVTSAIEGEYLDNIRNLIRKENFAKNIHLIPQTEEIFDYFLISDIFVCASFIESLPIVVLEAMAFEIPIIATNVFGIPEEIEDGKSGILIEPGNPKLLAEKIKFLLENERISRQYANNAYARVQNEFSIEKTGDKFQELTKTLITNSEKKYDIAQVKPDLKNKILLDILACPYCLNEHLVFEKEKIVCTNCKKEYFVKLGAPVFLTNSQDYIDRTCQTARTNRYSDASLELIEENKNGLVLDLGSGYPNNDELFPNVIYQEIIHYPSTDVVSNTKNLPFKDETFDAIICEAVFEHLRDPFYMAKEMFRVCKKGGKIRVDTAFLQPYHADPNHFYNMTIPGVEEVFHMFKKVRSGVDRHQKTSYTIRIFLSKYLELIDDQKTKKIIRDLLDRPLEKIDCDMSEEGHNILGAGVFFEGIKE